MKIGIVGSRRRNEQKDKNLLLDYIQELLINPSILLHIVSGGCSTGADRFAEEIAKEVGLSITIHYPNKFKMEDNSKWEYTKLLFARNETIAIDCDVLVALPASDRTGGTENTIKHAEKLNKKIVLL